MVSTPESSQPTTTTTSKSLGPNVLRDLVMQAAELDESVSLDLNGIVWLEHINLVVGSRPSAERFYLDLLGFTKDKSSSFHCNLGQQQFHLAAAKDGESVQRVTGSIGLVVPRLDTVRRRLQDALEQEQEDWKDTQFQILVDGDNDKANNAMTVICPWGNRLHLYDAQAESDGLQPTSDSPYKMVKQHAEGGTYAAKRVAVRGNPGIRYIEIACPSGSTPAIARFYQEVVGCTVTQPTNTVDTPDTPAVSCCCVNVGPGVHIIYVEDDHITADDLEAMKGVHICVYANDFKGLYERLKARNLIWTNPRFLHLDTCDTWDEAMASRTLRFKDIIDLEDSSSNGAKKVFELEHETRALRHGQYFKVPFYEPK